MRAATLVVALALALSAREAVAQSSPEVEARERFSRGVALYGEGNAGAALVEFQRAYELLGRRASLLFNIAVTQEALGRYVEALAAMREFSERAPAEAVASHRTEMDAALTRLPTRIGTLRLNGDLPGLAALVDDLERPVEMMRAGVPMSAGIHRVTFRATGRLERTVEVRVTGGEVAQIAPELEPARSSVMVNCELADAEVRVDGVAAGSAPLRSPVDVATGRHRVEVTREGYAPFVEEVDAHGLGVEVHATLAWSPSLTPETGARLDVHTSESGAISLIDGRRVRPGDLVHPGAHTLRITRGSFLRWERDVSLRAGEVARVQAWLEPTPSFRAGWLSDVSTRRTVALSFAIPGALASVVGVALTSVYGVGLVSANDSLTAADAQVERCLNPACDGAHTRAALDAQSAAVSDVLSNRIGLTVGVGVAVVGVASLITGLVLWSRAGSPLRFERPLGYEASAR